MNWWFDTSALGKFCHWCGKEIVLKRPPKTVNHRFCNNAEKMAHARAFAAWQKNRTRNGVTPGTAGKDSGAERAGPKSNAKRSEPVRTRAAKIAGEIPVKSNKKKRAK